MTTLDALKLMHQPLSGEVGRPGHTARWRKDLEASGHDPDQVADALGDVVLTHEIMCMGRG